MEAAIDPTITKPSRSDEVLDHEQQLRIADHVRSVFESAAPKRPAKPSRSESDSVAPLETKCDIASIPELEKLKNLKSRSEVVFFPTENGSVSGEDEYTETEYYKNLTTVLDEQHHTTGTGFINVEDQCVVNGNYCFARKMENGEDRKIMYIRCNPATNDWTPSVDGSVQAALTSTKPTRSG
ncbi:hypothetical protein AKJ16_DCAP22028 [Drosera capensis]